MRRLATDNCPLHHMAIRIAEGLNAQVSHVVVRRMGPGDEVTGVLRIVTATGLQTVTVDAAAGLTLAIHMGIPIFMDGEFSAAEPDSARRFQEVHDPQIDEDLNFPTSEANAEHPPSVPTPIPPAFQELIEGLKLPDDSEGPGSSPSPE